MRTEYSACRLKNETGSVRARGRSRGGGRGSAFAATLLVAFLVVSECGPRDTRPTRRDTSSSLRPATMSAVAGRRTPSAASDDVETTPVYAAPDLPTHDIEAHSDGSSSGDELTTTVSTRNPRAKDQRADVTEYVHSRATRLESVRRRQSRVDRPQDSARSRWSDHLEAPGASRPQGSDTRQASSGRLQAPLVGLRSGQRRRAGGSLSRLLHALLAPAGHDDGPDAREELPQQRLHRWHALRDAVQPGRESAGPFGCGLGRHEHPLRPVHQGVAAPTRASSSSQLIQHGWIRYWWTGCVIQHVAQTLYLATVVRWTFHRCVGAIAGPP